MPQKYAIHLGLNHVEKASYAGWDGLLNACVNDAMAMSEITTGLGYDRIDTLLDSHATKGEFLSLLEHAALELYSGDLLVVTYSGHGGMVPDLNGDETSVDKNGQAWDQTLCLYDAQLIDDELFQYWKRFREGVRIFMLSDCCHSGTITKDPESTNEEDETYRAVPTEALSKVNLRNALTYKEILNAIPKRMMNPSDLRASIQLYSACRDDQYARDGERHGLYTSKFLAVWREGFRGSYAAFHEQVAEQVPRNQQEPQHYVIGPEDQAFLNQHPFQV